MIAESHSTSLDCRRAAAITVCRSIPAIAPYLPLHVNSGVFRMFASGLVPAVTDRARELT